MLFYNDCRKVANREAARRMRQRRSEQLGSLSANNDGLKHENQQLQHQIAQFATQNRDLVNENAQLKEEMQALKQQLLAFKNPVGYVQVVQQASKTKHPF